MDAATVDRFFALATLAALVAVAGVVVLGTGKRLVPGLESLDETLRGWVGESGYWLAWLVALASLVGSLYYSEIVGYAPCSLCWYQRIAMYPLVIILGIAAWRTDTTARRYALPLVVIGGLIAAYQYVIGYFPDSEILGCSLDVSCTERYIWEFGFIDFPFMSLVAFTLIGTLMLWAPPGGESAE